ncbi:serine/threonine-protein kinase [Symmachiella dynata]|uniref:serine/threonine protein kinase n=1 Tax=Symmachiella dynata TaxID=2527995 RepID=UPI0030ECFAF5
MAPPQRSDRTPQKVAAELAQTVDAAAGKKKSSIRPIELVMGRGQTFGTETTSLLHTRLRAVTLLLLVVYGLIFLWAMINRNGNGGIDFLNDMAVIEHVDLLRLVLVGGIVVYLFIKPQLSQMVLRSIEYTLFGALTLMWIYLRYEIALNGAHSGNTTEMVLAARTQMFGIFMLIIVHGLLIPHRWIGTARVVFTMALAPLITLGLFAMRHADLVDKLDGLTSQQNVSTELLIVFIAALLATYGAAVLSAMRLEVHQAKKFGQYHLVKLIGSGGMGQVHLVEHDLLKRPCAMKLIRPEAAGNPTSLARFEREVQSTAALTHPNTIAIYDYGHCDDGTFYYIMEYLPGMSLDEMVEQYGPLPADRVIYLLRQACNAVADAHAAGLIHRDLKPANLFVSERGGMCDFIKVLDFGLVKLTNEPEAPQITSDQVISGTPLYMSPEQAVGDPALDGRTDMYALGAVAYYMLTGRPPFEGATPVAVMMAHATKEVEPPTIHREDIPADLQAVVLKCLAKKPADRYSDLSALEQALNDCGAAGDWNAKQAAQWWSEVSPQTGSSTPNSPFGETVQMKQVAPEMTN